MKSNLQIYYKGHSLYEYVERALCTGAYRFPQMIFRTQIIGKTHMQKVQTNAVSPTAERIHLHTRLLFVSEKEK